MLQSDDETLFSFYMIWNFGWGSTFGTTKCRTTDIVRNFKISNIKGRLKESRKNGPWKNGPQKIGPRETQKQKIVGWASIIVVCVWNVGMWSIYVNPKLDNKPKTRKQTQNSETKNRRVSAEHRGMCVECSDVINLWNPKTRQQTFLASFSAIQFGAYVGSWGKYQTSFCVCTAISR